MYNYDTHLFTNKLRLSPANCEQRVVGKVSTRVLPTLNTTISWQTSILCLWYSLQTPNTPTNHSIKVKRHLSHLNTNTPKITRYKLTYN